MRGRICRKRNVVEIDPANPGCIVNVRRLAVLALYKFRQAAPHVSQATQEA